MEGCGRSARACDDAATVASTQHHAQHRVTRAAPRVTARDCGDSLFVLPWCEFRHGPGSRTTQARRTGGAAERECTLSQISRFNRTSSARSATAKSPGGIGERYAWGFMSSSDQVFGSAAYGVAMARGENAFHRGAAAESYWLSGGRPSNCPMERTTE